MKKRKKDLKKRERSVARGWGIMDSPVAVPVVAILAIVMGVFFIVSQENTPVGREEAEVYEGIFVRYETAKNYCGIKFADGSTYEVYPHTEKWEFRERMESLPEGTRLYLLINPNNGYVAEIRTDSEELLNFEASQKEIDDYDNFYVIFGAVVCAGGVFLIWYALLSMRNRKKEEARRTKKRASVGTESKPLRRAGCPKRERIFHKVSAQGYEICYRRVGHVNELIVNGFVYDELHGAVEFPHTLTAELDGHTFTAGLDKKDNSYVALDGRRLAEKKRWI